ELCDVCMVPHRTCRVGPANRVPSLEDPCRCRGTRPRKARRLVVLFDQGEYFGKAGCFPLSRVTNRVTGRPRGGLAALSAAQVTSWGLLYYSLPVAVTPISQDTGWSPTVSSPGFHRGSFSWFPKQPRVLSRTGCSIPNEPRWAGGTRSLNAVGSGCTRPPTSTSPPSLQSTPTMSSGQSAP